MMLREYVWFDDEKVKDKAGFLYLKDIVPEDVK